MKNNKKGRQKKAKTVQQKKDKTSDKIFPQKSDKNVKPGQKNPFKMKKRLLEKVAGRESKNAITKCK